MLQRTRLLVFSLSFVLSSSFGCGFDVTVPAGTIIDCVDNSDCPEGYRCRPAINRCIALEDLEDVEPAIPTGPLVEPAIAGMGATVWVSFTVTHALFRDPRVYVETIDRRIEFETNEAETDREDLRYSFFFSPDGSEPEETLTVRADLVDQWGNESRDVRLGSLTFDFTPPTLGLVTISPELARPGDNVVVRVFISKPVSDGAVLGVVWAEGQETLEPLGAAAGVLTFVAALDSTAPDGPRTLLLSGVRDHAGNSAEHEPMALGSFVVDGTPPEVMNLSTNADRFSRVPGFDEVEVTFETSEPPSDLMVTVGSREASCVSEGGVNYTCTYRPSEHDSEGIKSVRVWAEDEAGNIGLANTSVVFDFSAPNLVSGTTELLLLPPPGCPLSSGVTKMATGSRARVQFVLDEPVGALPVVLADAPDVIEFQHMSGFISSFSFEGSLVEASTASGSYNLNVEVIDSVGNAAGIDLGLLIDVVTQRPLLQVDQDAVVFLRSPWGNDAPEDLGGFHIPRGPYFGLAPSEPLSPQATLPAETFSLVDGPPLLLQVWSSGELDALIGATGPNSDGTWPRLRLANLDTPSIHMSALDDACQASLPVKIENVEWVATPRAAGWNQSFNRLRSVSRAEKTMVPDERLTGAGGPEAWGTDGDALVSAAISSWREAPIVSQTPGMRSYAAMAHDPVRGATLLFGGENANGIPFGEIWEWDGRRWTERHPGGESPPSRSRHAMAFDGARGRIVLFGGHGGLVGGEEVQFQDIWEWDGQGWEMRETGTQAPPAQSDHAMAYDGLRSSIVMVGQQETWSWDGSVWENVTPSEGPVLPHGCRLAYDVVRAVTVAFCPGPKTFEWDGAQWEDVSPSEGSPSSRTGHVMSYDPMRERVVLFGGSGLGIAGLVLWEWDGTNWTSAQSAPIGSWGSHAPSMTYDSTRQELIIQSSSWTPETALRNGADWTLVYGTSAESCPPYEGVAAFDSARRRLVMVGGLSSFKTCEWDGYRWHDAGPPSGNPPVRSLPAIAYDAANERVVIFGGMGMGGGLQDTWEWNGQQWLDVTPATGNPGDWYASQIYVGKMAYDAANERIVLFGGQYYRDFPSDTWEWDVHEKSWSLRTTTGPPGRVAHSMVHDPLRGRILLFGGSRHVYGMDSYDVHLGDTWTWNGETGSWQEVAIGDAVPPARSGHTMAFDHDRGAAVLFGGYFDLFDTDQMALTEEMRYRDAWEWNGSSWNERSSSKRAPMSGSGHSMVFDDHRRVSVLVEGYGLHRVWEYSSGARDLPAFQFDTDLTAAGIDASNLQRIRVRAHCAGIFDPDGESVESGATLYGWMSSGPGIPDGSWQPLASNSAAASLSAPHLPAPPLTLMDWSTTDSEQAKAHVLERDGRVAFQCRSSGPAGKGESLAALDYIEVRVRHAAP